MKSELKKCACPDLISTKKLQWLMTLLLSVFFWQSGQATVWTTNGPGMVTDLSRWTNGTTSPSTFSNPGDTWTVQHKMTMASGAPWVVGTAATSPVSVSIAPGGKISGLATGFQMNITVYGNLIVADTIRSEGDACVFRADVYGNLNISGGSLFANGNTAKMFLTVVGNVTATGGSIYAEGLSSRDTFIVMGNFQMSGTSVISAPSPGGFMAVMLSLPTASGTMLISNTSTSDWGHARVYVDVGSTAQLNGDFTTGTGTIPTDILIYGTLICPAAYSIGGWGTFSIFAGASVKIAHPLGLGGFIFVSGGHTFSSGASYEFNGTVPQTISSYFPANPLVPPSVITINNPHGVTIGGFDTQGTISFIDGILHTSGVTVSGPTGNITGATATAFVDGWLYKTVVGVTNLSFEVGDMNYAPMSITLDAPGTDGRVGVLVTHGLHPWVATSGLSPANMVNEYWTVNKLYLYGSTTATVSATYGYPEITGGTNVLFVTQKRNLSAWLPAPIATSNTPFPYSSTTGAAIPVSSLSGDYIFGNHDCGTLPITGVSNLCVGAATILADATPGGTWSSGNPAVAPVSGTGMVSGLAAGTSVISYTASGCTVAIVMTVSSTPDPGVIAGGPTVCLGASTALSNTVLGGVWSSTTPSVGAMSSSGGLTGISAGTATISYTVTDACGTAAATLVVTVTTVPDVLPITGLDSVCEGETISLTSGTSGGFWTSYDVSLATVSATGVVTGVTTGIDTIYYELSNICGTRKVRKVVVVKPAGSCPLDVHNLPDTYEQPGIHLAPNPNTGRFKIWLSAVNEDASIVVTDVTGRIVKRFSVWAGEKKEVNLVLPPGVYNVSASTATDRYMARLLIR